MTRSSRLRPYISFFRLRFLGGMQYRVAAFAGILTQFAWGAMNLLLYTAFYEADPTAFPMGFEQISAYVWFNQAFLTMFMLWFLDADIFAAIRDGNVAYELVRPLDLYRMWFVKNLATRTAKVVLRCLPILVVAAFLPAPYGLTLPVSFCAFLLFLLTMVLALVLVVAFCMLIYIVTFYTMNPLGIRIIATSMGEFLCGALIPIPFMPDGLRRVIELSPFGAMQNLPFRIYSGHLAGTEMWRGILLQVFWIAALILLGRALMAHALRRVAVQGG